MSLMRVRLADFAHPVDIPGKQQADKVISYDPKYKQEKSWHLNYDTELQMLVVEVPDESVKNGIGMLMKEEGGPLYGLERVQHVPREAIKRIVFFEAQEKFQVKPTGIGTSPSAQKAGK